MNNEAQIIKQICGSLRKPQADSLKILADVLKIIELDENADIAVQLEKIKEKYPTVTDFARDFVCLCFALATGVGKTRLMGAFIAYLHKVHHIKNFMIIAPNITIYNKLIDDFSEGSPKYVFKGMGLNQPVIIKNESDYKTRKWDISNALWETAVINIFNIQKLTSDEKNEIRKLSETIGESYFDYLRNCDDLVLLMDEAHHYRTNQTKNEKAFKRAIDELNPVLGLELTATPFLPGSKNIKNGKVTIKEKDKFHNVIYNYELADAINDGFVKIPAVVTRESFNTGNYAKDSEELEHLKLKDGILLHERTKEALRVYAFNHGNQTPVKPFMLVVAGDIAHAEAIKAYLTSDDFCNGAYRGSKEKPKTIIIHSALEGKDKSQMVKDLQDIEKPDNEVEIVVHVNTLSEGWDVTNLYTLVPLRAANSPLLVFQSLGRGLRLPFGKRVGDRAVDTFRVVSHDNFDAIIKEAENQNLQIEKEKIGEKDKRENNAKMVEMKPLIDYLTEQPAASDTDKSDSFAESAPVEDSSGNKVIADIVAAANAAVDAGKMIDIPEAGQQVAEQNDEISSEAIQEAVEKIQELTISVPRITSRPIGTVVCNFSDFDLDPLPLPQTPISNKIKEVNLAQTDKIIKYDVVDTFPELSKQKQLLVSCLRNCDTKINYNDKSVAKLLQKLVLQYVAYLQDERKLSESDICNILDKQRASIASKIYEQMQKHIQINDASYEYVVESGYLKLHQNAGLIDPFETPRVFTVDLQKGEKEKITNMVFCGFKKCLYDLQKFDSDSERKFACFLEREDEILKWFRPALTDFSIRWADHRYKPDFIVEAKDAYYICEVKLDDEINSAEVVSKKNAAVKWCKAASDAFQKSGKKCWKYLLIPHSEINNNLDFSGAKVIFLQK